MDAVIEKFMVRGVDCETPVHNSLGMFNTDRFLGTLYATRTDGVKRVLDLYVSLASIRSSYWDPYLRVASSGWDMRCYITGLSADINTTDDQFAYFFTRDYVKQYWWQILSNTPFCP